jgi:hypothetical protein
MDSARHVITRIVDPPFLSLMESHDMASSIHQSLAAAWARENIPSCRAVSAEDLAKAGTGRATRNVIHLILTLVSCIQ